MLHTPHLWQEHSPSAFGAFAPGRTVLYPANSSIGIIGGADGPTAIFITAGFPWGLLFAILGCIALVILGIIMSRRPD